MIITRRNLRMLIKEAIEKDETSKDKKVSDVFSTGAASASKRPTISSKDAKRLQRWAKRKDPIKTDNSIEVFHPQFRSKVEKILSILRKGGPSKFLLDIAAKAKKPLPEKWDPKVWTAFRSLRDQHKIFKRGDSQVDGFGFHVSYGENAEKESWAADIVDKNYNWGSGLPLYKKMATYEFFLRLGQAAESVGITGNMWGGNWRPKPAKKRGGYVLTKDGWAKTGEPVRLGWDLAHVQGKSNSDKNKAELKADSLVGIYRYLKKLKGNKA